MVRQAGAVAVFLLFAVAGGGARGETLYPYRVIDLGTLGGNSSTAYAINTSGQVTGTAGTPNLTGTCAFLWSETGGMINLGALDGSNVSHGYAINSLGWVVGDSNMQSPRTGGAFLYTPSGGIQDLGILGAGTGSGATDINNAGVVVGVSATVGDAYLHPFVWDAAHGLRDLNNTIANLPSGWTPTCAKSINDSTQIVGIGYDKISTFPPSGKEHGFILSSGALIEILGPTGTEVQPEDINSSGVVTGSYYGESGSRAFIYTLSAGLREIGTLGGNSNASAINDLGQVVGVSWKPDGKAVGFLYDDTTGMVDLNTLVAPTGWKLGSALGINDAGWIVGGGYNPDGLKHGYLLVPTPTPEPNALVLLAFGATCLGVFRLTRRGLAHLG